MSVWLAGVIGGVVGLMVGVVVLIVARSRDREALSNARTRAEIKDEQITERDQQIATLQSELKAVDDKREAAEREAHAVREQKQLLEQADRILGEKFKALGAEALQSNSEQFFKIAKQTFENVLTQTKGEVEQKRQAIEHLTKPIKELLEKHHEAIKQIESKRERAYTGLEQQIKYIAQANEKLNTETSRLVTALRRPEQRGRWGELQLRNVVEMAGMTEHCDFTEQAATDDPTTRDRPDMTISLPGGGTIVVDSKVALDAYLDAIQPDTDREALLERHARQVESHYRALSNKKYWNQFDHTPKLVVMFVPLESALVAALERKPDLHADAMKSHVLIATPTLLVALLRAVAYGWQQEAIAANNREIADTGRELYERLGTFVKHFEKIGKNLRQSTDAYNSAVGSLERMVLPSSRKLKDLHATTDDDIDEPTQVDADVREITAGELRAPTDDGQRSLPD